MLAHFCVRKEFLTDNKLLKDLPGENKELEGIMVDPYKGLAEILDLVQLFDPSKRNQKK